MTENPTKIMKLSSGEEIICDLMADEHPRTFSVRYPMKVMTVPRVTRDGVEESLSLTRWMHFAEENITDIPKAQVLAIATASLGMKKFYEYVVNKMTYDGETTFIEPHDDDLESIAEEESLEELNEWEPDSKLIH
jgi:hypothetical protein